MTRRAAVVLLGLVVGSFSLLLAMSGPGEVRGPVFRQELPEPPRNCVEKGALFAQLGRNPGPRAVVHGLDGRAVDDPAKAARAPKPEILRTSETGFEPSLGVTGDGTIFTVGATCDTPAGQSAPFAPVLRSQDGGESFVDASPRDPAGNPTHPKSLDPYLYVDKDTDRVFTADVFSFESCFPISHSSNRGSTWTDSQVCGLSDHQNVFTGPPPKDGPQPSGYPNVVYYCAIDAGTLAGFSKGTGCAKSLDGGTTFVRTGQLPYVVDPEKAEGEATRCDGGTGPGFVDEEGTIYLPRGFCGQPFLAISRDEGATWTRVQVADKPLGKQTASGLAIYNHEATVAVDAAGNVFYAWAAGEDRLPYLAISRDGGKTFGPPRMMAPPGLKEVWNPTIDIGPEGRLAFTYVGSTNSPGPPFEGEYEGVTFNGYMAITDDALAAEPTFYTASVNDPSDPLIKGKCEPLRCGQQFDFNDIVVAKDGTSYASLIDGCTAAECQEFLGRVIVGRLPPPRGSSSSASPPSSSPSSPSASPSSPSSPSSSSPSSSPDAPVMCAATGGFTSVGVRPNRRGARLDFTRRTGAAPATVEVFQQSRGRRVIEERLVARFTGRSGAFAWDGRANRRGRRVSDGYYFVRYRTRGTNGQIDTRRITLRRSGGRFSVRRDFYRRATCDLVPSFKLRRPVFGGVGRRSGLEIAYRVSAAARVTVTVRRGGKVVRRFADRPSPANRTVRLRVALRGLRRGDYTVRLEAQGPNSSVTSTLVSRRL